MSQVQDQLGLFGEVQASRVYSIRLSQKLKQKNQQSKEKGRERETLRNARCKEWRSNKPNHRPAVRSESEKLWVGVSGQVWDGMPLARLSLHLESSK